MGKKPGKPKGSPRGRPFMNKPLTAIEIAACAHFVEHRNKTHAWRTMGRPVKPQSEGRVVYAWFNRDAVKAEIERLEKGSRRKAAQIAGRAVMSRAEALAAISEAARMAVTQIKDSDIKTLPGASMALVALIDRLAKLENWDKQRGAAVPIDWQSMRGLSIELRRERIRFSLTQSGAAIDATPVEDEEPAGLPEPEE